MATVSTTKTRIVSLDQFRGYTVAGMFLVNFLGAYTVCPLVLRHHNTYCSYADTIMPHFLFAVGFAFRLTFGRRVATQGAAAAHFRVVRRLLGLVLVSLIVYTVGARAGTWSELADLGFWGAIRVPLKRVWFQTLMHIAVTSLWILPVIRCGAAIRILYMLGSAAAHLFLSHVFYFEWVNSTPNGIDGGPLGFLTWSIPTIVGTLACDAVAGAEGRPRLFYMVFWSVILMGLGYLCSCGTRLYDVPPDLVDSDAGQILAEHAVLPPLEQIKNHDWKTLRAEPPFVPPPYTSVDAETGSPYAGPKTFREQFLDPPGARPRDESSKYRKWNYWMMCQRAGTISYLTFGAGLSLAVYVLFYVCCDILGWQIGLFRTFGTNALAAYVLHMMIDDAVSPFVTRDAPGWYVLSSFLVFFGLTYLLVRHLEKNNIFLKL
jgi:hypothetical protein